MSDDNDDSQMGLDGIEQPDVVLLAGPAGGSPDGPATESVSEPAKVMRVGSMIKQLLDEVKSAPLDEAAKFAIELAMQIGAAAVQLADDFENAVGEIIETVTSAATNTASGEPMAATAASPASRRRPQKTTVAPSACSRCTTARPCSFATSVAAPVTSP